MGTSANLVKVGEPVRLNVQLADGEESMPRVVKGLIRNTIGSFVQEITLTHVGGGLFKDDSYVMPEQDLLSVQYAVYEIDELTKDTSYSTDVDTFVRSDVLTGGSGGQSIADDEFTVTYREDPDYLVGVTDENN